MSLLQRLEMRQGQALVMTPQLLQAIKLLQLSQIDLATYVDAELERNPLLERVEGDADGERVGTEPAVDASGDGEGDFDSSEPDNWMATELTASGAEMESVLDTRLDNVFSDENPSHAREAASGDMLSLTPRALRQYRRQLRWRGAGFRGDPDLGSLSPRASQRAARSRHARPGRPADRRLPH